MQQNISDSVKYIGVDDHELDLFESQYTVPEGMCYNSYLIVDEQVAVMDTVDDCKVDEWLANLERALEGREPDYIVALHMEPDHASGLAQLVERYPRIKVVGNAKTFAMFAQFFASDIEDRKVVVKEGDVLDLGSHKLKFVFAPMVHWPEVMLAYDESDQTLYSADAFGKFGASDAEGEWSCEARRYYYNIVGKYGANVQALLKKLTGVEVKTIAPLHGPVLREDIGYYVEMYDLWSRYQSEEDGVMIAYASIHGNTEQVAYKMADILKEQGVECVKVFDLSRGDQSYVVEDAFQVENMILAAASYDAGVFPPMEHFLHHLKSKNYQGRKVAIIENGSWAPTAGKVMRSIVEGFKGVTLYDEMVTIRSSYKESDREALERLGRWISER
ncbi:MAG: FprA family A-type flavoprotein [Rikenellaceae bacterium]